MVEMTETTDLNRSSIDSYSAETIRILSGLEPIRVRPAMYIGAVGDQGLHQLVLELIQNAVDEAMAGHCTELAVTLASLGARVTRSPVGCTASDCHA
jgi:DNA gyrase subunit B